MSGPTSTSATSSSRRWNPPKIAQERAFRSLASTSSDISRSKPTKSIAELNWEKRNGVAYSVAHISSISVSDRGGADQASEHPHLPWAGGLPGRFLRFSWLGLGRSTAQALFLGPLAVEFQEAGADFVGPAVAPRLLATAPLRWCVILVFVLLVIEEEFAGGFQVGPAVGVED